jgi:hypothetical protein
MDRSCFFASGDVPVFWNDEAEGKMEDAPAVSSIVRQG